jgi:hypothetical protein
MPESPKNLRILNNQLIMPEYLIEYSLENEKNPCATKFERLSLDISYSNKLSHSNMPSTISSLLSRFDNGKYVFSLYGDRPLHILDQEIPLIAITESSRFHETAKKEADVLKIYKNAHIDTLNLSFHPWKSFSSFEILKGLKNLVLSGCSLRECPILPSLPVLELLDLSFNHIRTLNDNILYVPNLQTLNLTGNYIDEFENLKLIFKHLKNLCSLDLRYNKVSENVGLESYISESLPSLQVLNNEIIEGRYPLNGKSMPVLEPVSANLEILSQFSSSQGNLFRSLTMRTDSGFGSSAFFSESSMSIARSLAPECITTLELDGCNLFNLDALNSE